MSGTSVDGIDAALVEFECSDKLKVHACQFTPYPKALRNKITELALAEDRPNPADYDELDSALAEHYAQAALALISKAAANPTDILAIANHGQTVRHEPEKAYSLQLGSADKIAELCKLPTIGHFRQADLALGGQGAPLMPAFHKAIFAEDDTTTGILNIGGIANISCLTENVIGFDTGPGNTLLDQWVWRHQRKQFDRDGAWAASGRVIEAVMEQLLADPYFQQPYPKSTGTDYFNLFWLEQQVSNLNDYASADIQACLLALTVETIAQAIEGLGADSRVERLYVCGGGAANKAMMEAIDDRLRQIVVQKTDVLGVAADWVEAVGFAWLGYCHLHEIAIDLTHITGASQPAVLGQLSRP